MLFLIIVIVILILSEVEDKKECGYRESNTGLLGHNEVY